MVKDELFAIDQIERVYVQSTQSSFEVTIIVRDSDPIILDRLATIEKNVVDAFPWLAVDFDIIFRANRPLNDVVTPKGSLLFAR